MKTYLKKTILSTSMMLVVVATLSVPIPSYAVFGVGDIVFDESVFSQSLITATEDVAQTLKQVQEYATQLQQYENQLQNTVAPAAYVWDQATGTMNKLRGAIDTLNYYKDRAGNIEGFLNKYQDVSFYRNSPCYTTRGCTAEEREQLNQNMSILAQAQKQANDGLFKGIDQQQDSLQADARQLERLQSAAQGAVGQMQAIQYANQLASAQGNQLLQIRGLLIAQQNALAARNQVLADREAQEAAAGEQLRRSQYQPSPVVYWGPSGNHP
jgi:type IV secretion system protein TrbJ